MSERPMRRSFAGGEITPELFARLDLTKHQTGLALARNFEVLPHGPVRNRDGFEHVLQCKFNSKKAILLPFDYTTSQSFVVEAGDGYFRFHALGATIHEDPQTITAITRDSPGVVTFEGYADIVNGQWFYLLATGMDEVNGRHVIATNVNAGAHTFELTDLFGDPINTLAYSAFTAGQLARVYEIASPYSESELFDLHYSQDGMVLTITHPDHPVYELTYVGSGEWTMTAPAWAPDQAAPTGVTVSVAGSGSEAYRYTVTAIQDSDSKEESYAATPSGAVNNDLTVQGNHNVIYWTNADNAIRYNVYKESSGLYGFIGQSENGSVGFIDDNITPDISQTPPEPYDPFNSANYYPGACGHFEGRRWFAGSHSKPSNLYGTRSGTETNMAYSMPTRDDDSISVKLKSNKMGTIRHIIALSDLILLTSGGEWRVIAQNSDVVTPTTIGYKPQSYIGASNATPALADSAVLYGQDRGGHIRELAYSWEAAGYKSSDVSIMAPHLFDYRYRITQLAFVRQPLPCLWCVRDDGVLLGMTYVPEHQVFAWHQHTTAGYFESVCAASEDVTGV